MNIRNKKAWIIVGHIAGWGLFFYIQSLQIIEMRHFHEHHHEMHIAPHHPFDKDMAWMPFITSIFMVPLFYLNMLVLFPRFLRTKRYWTYLLTQIVTIIAFYLLLQYVVPLFINFYRSPRPDFFLINYFTISLAATCYCYIEDTIRNERIQKERENEALKSELSFLRWQISPHFLFNVLNNMVALARVRSEKMEPMLIRLSTLMRYMLYESGDEKISLTKEADYLQSYLDLQRLRFSEDIHVDAIIDISDNDEHHIESMLLIPFVENAFKHGVSSAIKDPVIRMSMRITENILYFDVQNKYVPQFSESKDETKGIGLQNVKRRLDILYGNKHELDISVTEGWYIVSLKINLS